jgi:hypothetical protein
MEEIENPTIIIVDTGTVLPFSSLTVNPASITTGGTDTLKYQSMLLSVSTVTVTTATTVIPRNNSKEFIVTDGLIINSGNATLLDYAVGEIFSAITGNLYIDMDEYKLLLRSAEDLR